MKKSKNIKCICLFATLFIVCMLLKKYTENLRIHGSYDLRGDPYIIPHNPFIPWNAGSSTPIRNRPLQM